MGAPLEGSSHGRAKKPPRFVHSFGGRGIDMKYPDRFKMAMVQRMAGEDPMTAGALSREVGVPQTTLSRWLRQASVVGGNGCRDTTIGFLRSYSGVHMSHKSPGNWKPEEKMNAVLEASSLPEEEIGAFLRSKGIHDIDLQKWRKEMLSGLKKASSAKKPGGKSPEAKRVRELERELNRKEKALAEAAALLVLKKKARAIWGDGEDDTPQRRERSS